MAKRKRPALFEMIAKDQRQGGALTPPAWWFKNRPQSAAARPTISVSLPPVIPVVARRVSHRDAPVPPPIPKREPPPVAAEPTALMPVSNGGKPSWLEGILAPLKSILTPVSAAIIGMAVIVVASGIYIEHRRSGGLAEATLQGPPHPDVLNVTPMNDSQNPAPSTATNPPPASGSATPAAATEPPLAPAPRQAGMGYILVHLYLGQHSADDVCQYLTAHGLPCSVERHVPGFAGAYFAVLGLSPFATADGSDCAAYIEKLKQELNSLPGATQITRSIRPVWVKWGTAS